MEIREIEGRALAPLETSQDPNVRGSLSNLEIRKVEGLVRKLLGITNDQEFETTAFEKIEGCLKFWESGDPALLKPKEKDVMRPLALARMRTSLKRTSAIDLHGINPEEKAKIIKNIRSSLEAFLVNAETSEVMDAYPHDARDAHDFEPAASNDNERNTTTKRTQKGKKPSYVNTGSQRRARTSGRH